MRHAKVMHSRHISLHHKHNTYVAYDHSLYAGAITFSGPTSFQVSTIQPVTFQVTVSIAITDDSEGV